MSGETEANVSGWTVDTLHTHADRQVDELDKRIAAILGERELRYEQRFQAQERASGVLATETNNRFASANEFREQARDRDDLFATKIQVAGMGTQLTDLKDRIARVETLREGQAKTLMGMVTVIGVILVLLNVAAFFIV